MAKSEQQRQRKLAKKKSKELESKKILSQRQQQMASLAGQMAAAARGQIEHCLISAGCTDGTGMGSVYFVRRVGPGQLMAAVFLVDVYCLGVKDALGRRFSPTEMSDVLAAQSSKSPFKSVSPGIARGFVEAAVSYAMSFGISPHCDYRKVAHIWGEVKPEPVPEEYRFGHEGKPHFIAGPYDDLIRQKQVVQALVANLGEGNFYYSLAGTSMEELVRIAIENSDLLPSFDDFDADDDNYVEDADTGITIDGLVTQRFATAQGK